MLFLYNLLPLFLHNPSSLQLLFVIITPSVSMFIGQGQSLDDSSAAQAERRAANATVVVAPVAEWPLSAAPPPAALLAKCPVSLFGLSTCAASLSTLPRLILLPRQQPPLITYRQPALLWPHLVKQYSLMIRYLQNSLARRGSCVPT